MLISILPATGMRVRILSALIREIHQPDGLQAVVDDAGCSGTDERYIG